MITIDNIIIWLMIGIIIDELINYRLRSRLNERISIALNELNQALNNTNDAINKLLEFNLQQEYLNKDRELIQKKEKTKKQKTKQVIKLINKTNEAEPEQSKKINDLLGIDKKWTYKK